MRSLVIVVVLVELAVSACEKPRDPSVATATKRVAPGPGVTPAPSMPGRPPPPPPPPPAEPSPQPPPASVVDFLRAHANDVEPWQVTFKHGRVRKRMTARDAAELARRLGEDAAYIDGDYGCVGQPVAYVVARGDASFAFTEDCGHMQIGEDGHAAMFSAEMVTFLQRTR